MFKKRVAEFRPAYLPVDPASRTTYVAGTSRSATPGSRRSSCRLGFGQTRTAMQLSVLTMVTGYSRWLSAGWSDRGAKDFFAGWWRHIQGLGAAPRTLVWDGEGAVGRYRGGRIELTGEFQAFRGVLGRR